MLFSAAAMALALTGQAALADEALVLAAVEVDPLDVIGNRDGYAAKGTATATRTDTPIIDVPQSISVITADVIRDQSMQTMGDVVRYVPGVSMGQGEGHRDAPTLRGNATTADFFVDGVRDDVQYFRDLYNAERVEVLKGPNAMIFGRGGGGGVINRVTKKANWSMDRSAMVELGSFDHRRATVDLSQPFSDSWAARLTGMVEDSESFRDFVGVERWGVNPTLGWRDSDLLAVHLGYEHFEDKRTVDRGLPSFNGRPAPAPVEAFFGDPDQSFSETTVDLVSAAIAWSPRAGLTVRNRTLFGAYDKFYQNVYPSGPAGAVGGAPSTFPLQAYNNLTERENLFTQTDLIWEARLGGMAHTVLAGVELGRQDTRNLRLTGRFNGSTTLAGQPFASPTRRGLAIAFTNSGSDANNEVEATVAAVYLQDQVEIAPWLQLIAGLRFDSFELEFDDRRSGTIAQRRFSRRDETVSPRLGVVVKPQENLSLYASYSVSFLPQSGDQFASLSASTASLEPEEFTNYEVGLKWELTPQLFLTLAAFQLDRDNTTATAPGGQGVVLSGSQRSKGFEAGIAGRIRDNWEIVGGYAWQEAEITSTTTAAPAGRKVPLVPEHTFSLWNKVQLAPMWGVGLGVVRQSDMYASISNAVVLPGFTRVDAAVYAQLTDKVRAQVNVENLTDEGYFPTSHGDNNILPGSPRAVRVSLTASF